MEGDEDINMMNLVIHVNNNKMRKSNSFNALFLKCVFIKLSNPHDATLIPAEMTMLPLACASDGYSHPPPLSRLLSPLSEPRQTSVSQVSHLQMSPLLHPLVGQHILTVSQFSKEQVLHEWLGYF